MKDKVLEAYLGIGDGGGSFNACESSFWIWI